MTRDELKQKYGNEQILAIPAEKIETDGEGPFFANGDILFDAKKDGVALYRYDAEGNPAYRQCVVYAIITDGCYHIFATRRLAGDARLTGRCSIGTGGHVAPGESFTDALLRELKEEVGLDPDNICAIVRQGFILDKSSAVNADHLGIVYMITIRQQSDIAVRETEKLAGSWVDSAGLRRLYTEEKLESWSEICYLDCI